MKTKVEKMYFLLFLNLMDENIHCFCSCSITYNTNWSFCSEPSVMKKRGSCLNTWAISFIREVSTVVGSIALPGRGKAECGELALLKGHSLHPQAEVTGTVRGSLTEESRTTLPLCDGLGASVGFFSTKVF